MTTTRFLPPNPGQSDYHWVRRYKLSEPIPIFWNAAWHANGGQGWGSFSQSDREIEWQYVAQCPMPEDNK